MGSTAPLTLREGGDVLTWWMGSTAPLTVREGDGVLLSLQQVDGVNSTADIQPALPLGYEI